MPLPDWATGTGLETFSRNHPTGMNLQRNLGIKKGGFGSAQTSQIPNPRLGSETNTVRIVIYSHSPASLLFLLKCCQNQTGPIKNKRPFLRSLTKDMTWFFRTVFLCKPRISYQVFRSRILFQHLGWSASGPGGSRTLVQTFFHRSVNDASFEPMEGVEPSTC